MNLAKRLTNQPISRKFETPELASLPERETLSPLAESLKDLEKDAQETTGVTFFKPKPKSFPVGGSSTARYFTNEAADAMLRRAREL